MNTRTQGADMVTKRMLQREQGLLRVTSLLSSAYTKKAVAEIIITEAFRVLEAQNGDIMLLGKKGEFDIVATKGYPKDFIRRWSAIPQDTPLLTNVVLQSKKAYFISDVEKLDKKFAVAQSFIKTSGAQSAALLPLKIRQRVLGIMQFTFRSPQRFTKADTIFMNTLANQCAQAFERVIALENLKESKGELEIILRNTADGIIATRPDGSIIYANNAVASFFGYASGDALKKLQLNQLVKQFTIFNDVGERIPNMQFISEAYLIKKDAQTVMKLSHKKTGENRWLVVTSNGIYDQSGNLALIISTLQDTTQLKELDQRKDEFISMASHELKTPLTSLHLYLTMLSRQLERITDEKSLFYFQKVTQQSDRLQHLVTDLLDVSRIKSGKLTFKKENFRIDQLVDEVVHELQIVSTSHRIYVEKKAALYVFADKLRIYQVVANLITNAIKYSPDGKKVFVRLEQVKDTAVVSIQDFGIGITKEHQGRIFDRFYQVNNTSVKTYPGLGMGLYIAQEVMRLHRGRIWVKSKPRRGATFSFSLPITQIH